MPLFQYFGWVGSFLLAALFAANWCVSAPIARAAGSDVALDQKINIGRNYLAQERPDAAIEHLNKILNTEKLDKPKQDPKTPCRQ